VVLDIDQTIIDAVPVALSQERWCVGGFGGLCVGGCGWGCPHADRAPPSAIPCLHPNAWTPMADQPHLFMQTLNPNLTLTLTPMHCAAGTHFPGRT
jgi:hypothetical protein